MIEYNEAKELVIDYLKVHKRVSLFELSFNLDIDLKTLCEIIDDIQREGLIKEVKDQ